MKKTELLDALLAFWQLLKHKDMQALFADPTQNIMTQFFRYIFVGMFSFFIDFACLYLLEKAGLHYLTAAGIAFAIGIAANFLMTKFFVFKEVDPTVGPKAEIAVFLAIAGVGLALTELLMFFFTGHLHIYFMTSKFISALMVFLWNFLGRKLLLYRGKIHQPVHAHKSIPNPSREPAGMSMARMSQSTSTLGN